MKQTWEIDNTVTISLVRIDLMHSRGHFTYWVSHLFSNKCIVIYVPICTLKNSSRSEHFSSYPLKQFSCSEFWISGYSILKPLLAILSKSEHFFPILSPMFGRCFLWSKHHILFSHVRNFLQVRKIHAVLASKIVWLSFGTPSIYWYEKGSSWHLTICLLAIHRK